MSNPFSYLSCILGKCFIPQETDETFFNFDKWKGKEMSVPQWQDHNEQTFCLSPDDTAQDDELVSVPDLKLLNYALKLVHQRLLTVIPFYHSFSVFYFPSDTVTTATMNQIKWSRKRIP